MRGKLALCLTCLLVALVCAKCQSEPSADYWMGVYYHQTKIGYQHTTIRTTTIDGKAIHCRDDEMHLRILGSGRIVTIENARAFRADAEFNALSDGISGSYDGTTAHAACSYGANAMLGKTGQGTETKETSEPIDGGLKSCLVTTAMFEVGAKKLSVGDAFGLYHCEIRKFEISDGLSPSIQRSEARVLRREKLELDGVTYDTFVVSDRGEDGEVTSWLLANGETVRKEIGPHVTYVRETKEKATSTAGKLADRDKLNDVSADYWMGIYYKQTKLGYQHTTIKRDRLEGKGVYRRDDVLHIRYTSSGQSNTAQATRTLYTDNECNRLQDKGTFTDSGRPGEDSVLLLSYGPKSLRIALTQEGKTEEKTWPLDDEDQAALRAGSEYDLGATKLIVGETMTTARFELLRLEVGSHNLQFGFAVSPVMVTGRKRIDVGGTPYDAFVITEKSKMIDSTTWLLDSGEIVKQEIGPERVTWIRETKEKATEIDRGPGADLDKLKK